jgi:hypothetical protein
MFIMLKNNNLLFDYLEKYFFYYNLFIKLLSFIILILLVMIEVVQYENLMNSLKM